MKLTNPQPDELRHAFAIEVAKYTLSQYGEYFTSAGLFVGSRSTLPAWDESVDLVLPYLEGSPFDVVATYSQTCCAWIVRLQGRFTSNKEFIAEDDDSPARASVIALLRAHGVEVEFTP